MHKKCLANMRQDDFCVSGTTKSESPLPTTNDFATLFSTNPTEAISSIIQTEIIDNSPSAIARFLFDHRENLNPVTCGEYLASKDQKEILDNFVGCIDFDGLDFEMSLRRLMRSMSMPGESQKIDRVMCCFGRHFMSVLLFFE